MSELKHYYGLNHLHYLTSSTYRRARLFDSERFKKQWVATFGELRGELKSRILGYVLMPEHFHALIWPAAEANPSQIMQKLEDRTAFSGMTVRSWVWTKCHDGVVPRGAYIPTKTVGTYAPPAAESVPFQIAQANWDTTRTSCLLTSGT